jgi:hypothetical protein
MNSIVISFLLIKATIQAGNTNIAAKSTGKLYSNEFALKKRINILTRFFNVLAPLYPLTEEKPKTASNIFINPEVCHIAI